MAPATVDQPLKLGLTPWRSSADISAHDLCHQAELAEQWGYDSFWLPESHFAGEFSIPDPLLLLAAIAGRTTSIGLGTTSYLLPIRHPLQAAEQVAVLDQLCRGRLILGLGRGFQPGMLDAYNVAASEKRTLFERTLNDMKSAWAGNTVGSPEHAAVMAPLPLQQPHPPLWMAAFGPKALAQAAKLDMPYLASPMESLSKLESNLEIYHRALDRSGNERPAEVVAMRTVFISDDQHRCDEVRSRLKALTAPGLQSDPEWVENACLIGSPDAVADQIGLYRQRLRMNYLIAARPRITGLNSEWLEDSMQNLAVLRPHQ